VWLLTEVSERLEVPGTNLHLGTQLMAPRRRWAGILTTLPLTSLPEPHPASASAIIEGITFCSSILPWRGCGDRDPWDGERHHQKTEAAVADLLPHLRQADRLVWGGDWNHALSGREYAGSKAGRTAILAAVNQLHLAVPTAGLPHQIEGLLSIDHLAIGPGIRIEAAHRIVAALDGSRLSDHDAYVANVILAGASQL